MNAKAEIIEGIRQGLTVAAACKAAHRSVKSYEAYMANDAEFRSTILQIRALLNRVDVRKSTGTFEDFCATYLGQQVFWHQLQWIDLIEGRPPRKLHPAETYIPGRKELLLVNTPPEHCAEVSTPVLTGRGWTTVGDVQNDDFLVGPDGHLEPVLETWEADDEVPLFRVTFNTGDSVVTDAGHKWQVYRCNNRTTSGQVQITTADLASDLRVGPTLKWRVKVAPLVEFPEVDLPLDPYLLGYWLGDGDSEGSRIAVGDEDTAALLGQLDLMGHSYKVTRDSRGRSNVVYVHGIRKHLPLGNKHIPTAYLTASPKQRLALLQGLLDSDGTITAKDGRARFVQHGRPELCQAVYRLAASLGYQPRQKTYGAATEVSFKPNAEPVFRLERKASRQFTRESGRRTDFRTVVSVEPAGTGRVKCITVISPGNTYLIGNGLIETGNAKSTTITANYVTYRICADPNVRIIIVSKTKEMAKKFVYQIKNRLTHPRFMKLQMDFAPPGGFQASSDAWTADMIYLGSENRDSGEKDPTLLALGIGGQIYGARADLIIVDDAVTLSNAQEYEKQIDWLTQEVLTRLSDTGKLMVVGTRVASVDLYSEIQQPGRWPDGKCEWTYMCQPAVLELHEDPKQWKTLWPQTNDEQGNLIPKWDGPALFRRRGVLQPRTWSLVYQQQQVQEDATFPPADVRATVNAMRMSGPIPKNATNCRPEGMEGLYVIAGMDPASVGHTAITVLAVDRSTRKRYVLEVVNQAGMTPHAMRQQIKRITERHGVHEWRIEKNAFQTMLTQDAEIREFLASRGSLLKEHQTSGSNKWDADFGVASMALLFDGAQEGRALIELPSSQHSEGVKALVEQLITWFPETKNKTDCVMSLWFAELRAREICERTQVKYFGDSQFTTPWQKERRMVVNIDDFLAQKQASFL